MKKFMIFFAISQATTIVVAHTLGEKQYKKLFELDGVKLIIEEEEEVPVVLEEDFINLKKILFP